MDDVPGRILLIEDNPGDARLIEEMLSDAGGRLFHLVRVERLSAGLERLAVGDIAAVLLDLGLPDSQGFETFDRVQRQAPQVPIILLTGRDDEELAIRAVRQGGQDYLVKGQVDGRLLARTLRYGIERKRAQEALLKFKLGIERSTEAVFMTDIRGEIIYVNPAFENVYGYRQAEALGQTPRILKSGVLDPEFYRSFWETLLNKGVAAGEVINKAKDGRLLHIAGSNNPILDEAGNIVGFLGIHRDITVHKQAEEALKNSEKRFRALIENGLDNISLLAVDGTLLWESPAVIRSLGYVPNAFIGHNIFELMHPNDLDQTQNLYTQLIQEPASRQRGSFRLRHSDGTWRWIEAVGTNLLNEPSVQAIVINYRDITERVRAEEALRESEVRFRALIENSADAITLIDAKGISVYDSPAVPRILGYRPKERVGQDIFELIHADDLHKIRDLFQNLVETPGAHVSSTFRLHHKNGLWLWIEAEAANLLAEPSVKAIVVNYRDISERVQAELELHHRKEDLELINTLNELVNRGESLDKLIDTLSSETRRIFSAHACTVFLLSPDGQVLTIPRLTISPSIIEKIEQMLGQPIPPLQIPIKKGGCVQKKLKAEQGVITSDPKLIRQWIMEFAESTSIAPVLGGLIRKLVPQIHKFLNIGSTLTVPLISDNKTIGLLELASAGLYTADDLTRVRNISGQVTAAIVRKQDEEALAASEAELRALFASMQDVVLVIDREGVYRKIAPTHPNLLVAPPEELLGKTLQDVFPPEQAEAFVGVIRQALETQQTVHIEYELVINGRPVWFETSVSPMGADSTVWVARDITARKQAEDARRESEDRYRDLVENSQDLICTHDLEGKLLSVNEAAARLSGYSREALLRMNMVDLLVPEVRRLFSAYLTEIQASGQARGLMQIRTASGETRFWEYNNTLRTESVAVPVVRGMAHDITERKQAEQALHENETRLRQITDNMLDVIGLTDTQGVYKYVSPSVKTVLGYEPSDILGRTMFENSHPDDLYRVMRVSMRALHASQTGRVEARYRHSDGHYVWLESTGTSVMDSNGNIIGAVTSARDITARKQRERELESVAALSAALRAAQTLDEMLPRLLDETLAVVGTDAGALWLYDPARGELREAVARGWFTQLDETPMMPGEGIGGSVFAAGEARLSREFARDPLARESSRPQIPPGWGGAGLPIRSTAEVVGVFFVSVQLPRELTPPEIHLLTTLAEIAGSAIHRARLFDETRRRADEFAALHETAHDLNVLDDLGALLEMIVERASTLLATPRGLMYLYDATADHLELKVEKGALLLPHGARLAMGEGLAGRVAQTRKPIFVDNYSTWEGRAEHYQGIPLAAVLEVPMLYRGELIGVLGVSEVGAAARRFDDADARLLSLFASQAAGAVRNVRLLDETRRRAEQLAALHEVGLDLSAQLDLPALLQAIVERAARLLDAPIGGLYLLQPDGETLELAVSHNLPRDFTGARLQLGEGLCGRIAQSGEPLVVGNYSEWAGHAAVYDGLPLRAVLGAPIKWKGKVIGVINVNDEVADRFGPADVEIVSLFADQAAVAIVNARLYHSAMQAAERQAILYRASQEIGASLEREQVYTAVHRAAAQLMPCEAFVIGLLDESRQEIEGVYLVDRGGRTPALRIPAHHGLSGRVIATGEVLRLDDFDSDQGMDAVHFGHPEHVRSILAAPLRTATKVIGVLSAQSYQPGVYTPDDEPILSMLANQAAVAIENARLFQTEREQRELAETLREVGAALTATLDFDTVLDRLLELIARVVPYDSANVMLVDDGRVHIARMCGYEQFGEQVARDIAALSFEVAGTDNLRWMAETRQPLVVPDTAADPGWVKGEASARVRSWAGAPLVVRDQVIAFFSLDKVEPNFYRPGHGERLAAFAAQAALALQNARLFDGLAAEKRRLELLYDLSENLAAILDPRDVAVQALDLTTSALGVFKGEVLVCEPGSDRLRLVAVSGYEAESIEAFDWRPDLRIGQGLAGYAALTRAPVIAPDVARDEHWVSKPGADDRVRSAVAIPLVAGDQLAGVLNLLSDREDFFRARDLPLLTAVAAPIALALQKARLFEAVSAQLLLAQTLQEVGASLTSQLGLEELMERVLDLLGRVVQYDSISIQLIDEDGYLYLAAGRGFPDFEQARRAARDLTDHSMSRKWAVERKAIVIPDTNADDNWAAAPGVEYIRSWIGAPLLVKDRLIGTLNVDSRTVNAFDAAMGQTVLVFANQAAVAIENARLFEAERDQARRLAAIGEVVRQATSLDLDQLLHRVVDLVQQAFDYYCVNVLLVDPPAGEIVVRASAGAAGRRPFEDYRLKIGEQGITGWVAASGQPLLVNDVEREPRYYSILEVAEARSELAVPILSAGQVIGVLDAQSNRRGAFAEADCDMLQTLAAHLAVAIANAQSFEDAARRFNDMRLLREVEVLISASLDLHTTLTAILDQVVMQLAIDAADILLLQSETGILEHAAGRGFRTEALQHTRLWVGEGYAGRAARERRFVNIPDLRVSDGDLSRAPLLVEEAFVAYYGVPFMAKGQITGVLELFHRSPFVIEPERLEFLQALAAQAAIAIENATLFDNLQRSHQALRDAQTRLVSAARLTAVGELAAGVAHQINNPLTTVIADAQLLLKSVSPDHPGYASAAAIFQAGWRAQRVVQRLLSFARPDEGKYIPTDVNETLVEALDLLGALIGRGGADVKVQLATDLPPIPANGHQLEEVWINLLMNARDALVEGRPGVITLSSRLAAGGAAVEVEVADNGRGLGEADRLHLFTPFFTTKGQGRGNGLGLSVCRSIVQDHGGQIQFESQPGEGTAFVIRLPLKRGSA